MVVVEDIDKDIFLLRFVLYSVDIKDTEKFLQKDNLQSRTWIRGIHSDWSPDSSGVPQGTILGPILFLIYVNDKPEDVKSTIKLFADDTKIYRELTNPNVITTLLSDLDSLDRWATDWQVEFNTKKCEVMRITHKKDKNKHSYYLSNTLLKSVYLYKDQGPVSRKSR